MEFVVEQAQQDDRDDEDEGDGAFVCFELLGDSDGGGEMFHDDPSYELFAM